MVDSIQRVSSIPLPPAQTDQGVHNPLPLDAPKELDRLEDVSKTQAQQKTSDDFSDYLNQSSVTTLEKKQADGTVYDPAADIANNSVYSQQSGKLPF